MLCALLMVVPMLHAQTRINADYLLGAGGSNFSDKTPKEILDNNGLRTGQYSGEHHLVGAYMESAYTSFLSDLPYTRITPGGFSIGGAIVYEYQIDNFLFQTGVGITRQDVWTDVRDTTFAKYHTADAWTNSMVHRYGDWIDRMDTFYYDLVYNFYDRRDYSTMTYVQLPLLFGQQINGRTHSVGYYLVGFKLNWAWRGRTAVKATGTTVGHYDRYFGLTYDPTINVPEQYWQFWHEMDNHGLRSDVPIQRDDDKLDLKLDVLAHAEIGWEYGIYSPVHGWRGGRGPRPFDMRLRMAAFCDFGILNINPNSRKKMVYPPDESRWDFPTYRLHHAYATEEMTGRYLRNMFVGIKLTCLFGIKRKQKCIICRPPFTEADMANPYRDKN